jgi:hypothetical protein
MTAMTTLIRSRITALGALLVVASTAIALASAVPAAAAAPALDLSMNRVPNSVPQVGIVSGGRALYSIGVTNSGDAETSGAITVDFSLPAGLSIVSVTDEVEREFGQFGFPPVWDCAIAGDSRSVSCEGIDSDGDYAPLLGVGGPFPIGPGGEACLESLGAPCRVLVTVQADSDLGRGILSSGASASLCGGGVSACPAAADTASEANLPTWRPFDMIAYDIGNTDALDNPYTQAGGHPEQTSAYVHFTETVSDSTSKGSIIDPNGVIPAGQVKDIRVELPPGMVGNPLVVDRCSEAQLAAGACPSDSQVGILKLFSPAGEDGPDYQIYNMIAPPGRPAMFGLQLLTGIFVHLYPEVRSNGDYGLTMRTDSISQGLPLSGFSTTFWGVPADPSHDDQRTGPGCPPGPVDCPSGLPEKAFLSLPTSCTGPQPTPAHANSWLPGQEDFVDADFELPANTGCPALDFSPTLQARPTTNVADSPSGLDVDLHIPQNDDPDSTAEAHLKDATVTLPEGMAINPASANGLEGCSAAQIGLTTPVGTTPYHTTAAPANCPDASKIGTLEVDTPLLDHPLNGAVYIAKPFDNPFDSLLAIYLAVDDLQSGVVVKLAGQVVANPDTGQLVTSFKDGPQMPFEHFILHFKNGAGAPLRTPALCGDYSTTSELVPWSGNAAASPQDDWSITQSPQGACVSSAADQPNAPSFDAGTVSPIAKSYSPFVIRLRREDGSQQFSAVTVSPPPGLVAKLAGTATCSESALAVATSKSGTQEKASPSCPADSHIGTVVAGAGAGPAPYYAPGDVYLAGPYKGAPLSFAIVTPAAAGPYDLGTIVVRTAIYVDSKTAKITGVSDPIPSILAGIPLDVRTVDLRLDRPDFTLNGSSCDPSSVNGQVTSLLGQVVPLSSRFQLAECAGLGLKPKMSLQLKGGTTRGKHPALRLVLRPRQGDANLASLSVALPRSEFLDQGHIGTVCTRVQFAADECPAASIYGEVTVETPILGYPLTGHAYLRSSDNLLPDLVPDLRGPSWQPIKLEAAARTDSVHGGLRSTTDFVPDAPFSKLVVQLRGGRKGLLQNSTNICRTIFRARVEYTGQNGKVSVAHPALRNPKCPKRGGKRKHRTHADRSEGSQRRAAR